MDDQWQLSGDAKLNEDSRRIARRAVAQSLLNVLDAFKTAGPVDLPAAYKRVWDYTPDPQAKVSLNHPQTCQAQGSAEGLSPRTLDILWRGGQMNSSGPLTVHGTPGRLVRFKGLTVLQRKGWR
jgi:hypothetical protein